MRVGQFEEGKVTDSVLDLDVGHLKRSPEAA